MSRINSLLTEAEFERARLFLEKAKPIIRTGDYTIQRNYKNDTFDDEYPLKDDERKRILLSLNAEDCIKIDKNTNQRYEDSEIFAFLKKADIIAYGEEKTVKLYIKMYIRENKTFDIVIVISFHKEGVYE